MSPSAGTAGSGSQPAQTAPPTVSTSAPTPTITVPHYYVPAPQTVSPGESTVAPLSHASVGGAASQTHTGTQATAAARSAGRAVKPHHRAARARTGSDNEAAILQRLLRRMAVSAHSSVAASAREAVASAPARRDGTLLLIGAAVLLVLAGASAALLHKLWRLHGQWYGGRPA